MDQLSARTGRCSIEGDPIEKTSMERERSLQRYDQSASQNIGFELNMHDSFASATSKVAENNRRKIAAIIQRQQRRQANQIGFLTQQLCYSNHDQTDPFENFNNTRNEEYYTERVPNINPQGQTFNFTPRQRPHDSIFASLQIQDPPMYATGNSILQNRNHLSLIQRSEMQKEANVFGHSILPTEKQLHHTKFSGTSNNDAMRSIKSFQPQTMRTPISLDNPAEDGLRFNGLFSTMSRSDITGTDSYFSGTSYTQLINNLRESALLAEVPPVCNAIPIEAAMQVHGIITPTTVPMHSDTDVHHLSKYQCLIRKQLEFFAAKRENAVFSVQGRKKPIRVGQVGIQCRHCCHLPHRTRGRGAVYYPVNLAGVYQAVQNMATVHLNQHCAEIPGEIRNELKSLRGKRDESASTGGKYYWTSKCEDVDIKEYADGIFFTNT